MHLHLCGQESRTATLPVHPLQKLAPPSATFHLEKVEKRPASHRWLAAPCVRFERITARPGSSRPIASLSPCGVKPLIAATVGDDRKETVQPGTDSLAKYYY